MPGCHRLVGPTSEALGSTLERFDHGMSYIMSVVRREQQRQLPTAVRAILHRTPLHRTTSV
jgi:hypothetical protein